MPSRYYRLDDDRELGPAPEWIPCDVCGLLVAITDEDDDEGDEDEILCLRCANEREQRVERRA